MNHDLITKVEALTYLRHGTLPQNFKERVENLVEFYQCGNCGGVQDMSFVLREWSEPYSPCPDCVGEDEVNEH